MVGVVEVIILSGPHLVLTDLGGHDGLALGDLIEFFYDILGLDPVCLPVGQWFGAFPFFDLIQPWFPFFLQVAKIRLGKHGVQLFQSGPAVSHDRNGYGNVLADRCRIDVDVNDFCLAGKGIGFAGDPIIEAHTDERSKSQAPVLMLAR